MHTSTDQHGQLSSRDAPFSAVLTPHRSLGPRGFIILMTAIGIVSFGTGLAFILTGAWPVFGFFGLDFLLIYLAFKLNYRSAKLYETVELDPNVLRVTRVHPSGRQESWEFNPYWVRLELEEDDQGDQSALKLRSHGRELVVGGFLSEDERRDFAQALNGALFKARSGALA
jgi:uncharacterized membrane protein